jgi:ATP-binding cassette, subfamily B, bacterial
MNKTSIIKAFKILWGTNKYWVLFSVLFSIIMGFNPLLSLWISKELINSVADVLQNKTNDTTWILFFLLTQLVLTLFSSSLYKLKEYLDRKVETHLDHYLQKIIYKKNTSVPLTYFDIPEFYNYLKRVQGSQGNRFLSPIRSVIELSTTCISFFSFLAFLFNVHWSLIIICSISAIPIFLTHSKLGNSRYSLLYNQTPLAREALYTSNLLQDRQSAKEIRLFGLKEYLIKRWSEIFLKNRNEALRLAKKQQFITLGLDGLNSLIYIGSSFFIIKLILQKTLKIGDFIAIGQAVQQSLNSVNRGSTQLARIYEDSLYLSDFFNFIEFDNPVIQPQQGNEKFPNPVKNGITIENVNFSYFGGSRDVLKNISLHIQTGEKIAIVGENGSGKTTLIKCLLGLYPVTEGNIYIDNLDIQKIVQSDLHQNFTVIFQDFMKYSYTIRENIALGNLSLNENFRKIQEVALSTGVDEFTKHFKNGYDTYLGRYLREGEDLSGGQWQKIALARALIRDAQIVILDEPTAALDPKAEMDVFNQFDFLTQNKTAIFISHRMSATKLADRIVVMKNGEIVEVGTFTELIELNGEFTRMYKSQSQHYQIEPITSS